MKNNIEAVILDDGITYVIVDTIDNYVYLANINDEKDFCIRKIVNENNEELLQGLENEKEFNNALLKFTNKNII